jgi:hypothetical protein
LVDRSLPRRSQHQACSAWSVSVTGRRPPRRAGTAVSAATASTVASTTASSCQSDGSVALSLSPPVIALMAANSAKPPGKRQDSADERGKHLRGRQCRTHFTRGCAEGAGQRRGMPVVEHRRPGDNDGVDRRQREQHDHHDEEHPAQQLHLSIVISGGGWLGTEEGVEYQSDEERADRDRDTDHTQHDPSRPAGHDSQGEKQRAAGLCGSFASTRA